MDISKTKNKCPVFRLSGELDHHNAQDIRRELDHVIKKYSLSELILDLKDLKFMDSSGIGVVLGRYKLLKKRHGELYVRNVGRNVDKIFKMSGLYQIIKKIN